MKKIKKILVKRNSFLSAFLFCIPFQLFGKNHDHCIEGTSYLFHIFFGSGTFLGLTIGIILMLLGWISGNKKLENYAFFILIIGFIFFFTINSRCDAGLWNIF